MSDALSPPSRGAGGQNEEDLDVGRLEGECGLGRRIAAGEAAAELSAIGTSGSIDIRESPLSAR